VVSGCGRRARPAPGRADQVEERLLRTVAEHDPGVALRTDLAGRGRLAEEAVDQQPALDLVDEGGLERRREAGAV
jgi:hypothetical protein